MLLLLLKLASAISLRVVHTRHRVLRDSIGLVDALQLVVRKVHERHGIAEPSAAEHRLRQHMGVVASAVLVARDYEEPALVDWLERDRIDL